jgi:hypothetical protein
MKSTLSWFIAGIFILSLSAGKAAHACSVSFQPDYSVYTDESTDGTCIYTSVQIDGSGEMTVNYSDPSCASLPPISHTPYVADTLNGGGGNWVSGGSYCPDCYLSSSTEQNILATPGTDYTFSWGAEVYCTIGGYFFTFFGSDIVGLSQAFWGPPPVEINGECHWGTLACSSGTPRCTNIGGFIFTEGCPNYMRSTTLILDGSCQPNLSYGHQAAGPGQCY